MISQTGEIHQAEVSSVSSLAELYKDSDSAVARQGHDILFGGIITKKNAAVLVSNLTYGDTLYINSLGGEKKAALDIGEVVFNLKIIVKVTGSCDSACSMFILLPAVHKSVPEGKYALFHNSPTSWKKAIKANPKFFKQSEIDDIKRQYDRAIMLYRRAGINIRIFDCIDKLQEVDVNHPFRGEDIELPVKSEWVSISPDIMKKFGVEDYKNIEYESDRNSRGVIQKVVGKKITWLDNYNQCS